MIDPTNPFAPLEVQGWLEECCLCLKCTGERQNREQATLRLPSPLLMDWRFACTGSNESGQTGSGTGGGTKEGGMRVAVSSARRKPVIQRSSLTNCPQTSGRTLANG